MSMVIYYYVGFSSEEDPFMTAPDYGSHCERWLFDSVFN